MTLRLALLASAALLSACATAAPALARNPHGIRAQVITESFGAQTPAGLGGLSYADLNYNGAAGTLVIASQTDASAAPVSTFAMDGASQLVPAGTYCSAAPCSFITWNGPYSLTLTGSNNYRAALTINILAAKAHFTSRCAATSTPPTCSDPDGHADSTTNSQLRTLVANRNAYPGDETLVGRNTPTFGLQFAPFGVQFGLKPPAGPYPGFLWITSEYANTAIYPQATAATGGGSIWGQVNWDTSTAGDIDVRAGTAYVTHYTDYPTVSNNPLLEKSSATNGFGFIVDHDDFFYGPDVANAYQEDGFNWLYRPDSASPCDPDHPGGSGVACVAATVRDSTFHNVENAIQVTSSFSTVGPTAGSVILRNSIWGQMQDAIDYMPGGRTDIEHNFITLPNSCCLRHADTVQGFGSASQNGLGANQGAGTIAYNIAVRGRSNLGATVLTWSAPTTSAGYALDGTWKTVLFSGGTGLRATGNLTVAGGVATIVTPQTSEAEGSDSGGGYAVGQVLTPIAGTGVGTGGTPSGTPFPGGCAPCTTVTITSVQGRVDFQGVPFNHDTNIPFTAPLTALSWSAGIASATTSAPVTASGPPYYVNIAVSPAGSAYNKTFPVTFTDSTHFTFPVATDPGTPSSLQTAGWGWDRWSGGTIHNNVYIGTYGNGITDDPVDNGAYNYNLAFYDVTAYHPTNSTSTVGIRVGSNYGAVGANFDYSSANVFAGALQTGTITCLPGLFSTNPKCSGINQVAATLPAYQAIIPGWNTDYLPTRASVIAMITPSAAAFAARSGAWPVTPPDSTGHACWNGAAVVYDVTKTCVGMGSLGPAD